MTLIAHAIVALLGIPAAFATPIAQPAQAPPAQPAPIPAAPAPAPAPTPDTDIFVADIDLATGRVGAPRNVTARRGYDNQPAFLAGGNALLYVARDDSGSTDVWRVDLATGARTQVTHTPEAEFSPTPLADESGFTAVRVESPHAEGEEFTNSQRLFKYDFKGEPIAPILPNVRRVGYHAWIDSTHVALFIVGNDEQKIAHSLVLAETQQGVTVPLANDIGRSLGRAPDGRVTFVDQSKDEKWTICTIAAGESTPTPIVAVPQGRGDETLGDRSQDFRWLPDGSLLMAHGNRLLRWTKGDGASWQRIAEFADLPGRIRRLAIGPGGDRVAFVVDMPAPKDAQR